MVWVDLIGYLLECFGEPLIRYSVSQLDQNRACQPCSGPRPEIHPDDWKCPDASEVARVLGATLGTRDARRSRSLWDHHAPVRPRRPEVRPQVSTHPDFPVVGWALEGFPPDNGTRPDFSRVAWALDEDPAPRTVRLSPLDPRRHGHARSPRPGPRREVHPDDWTCPDFSEIARIVGAAPVPTTEPLLPLFSARQHPLWDRDLDG